MAKPFSIPARAIFFAQLLALNLTSCTFWRTPLTIQGELPPLALQELKPLLLREFPRVDFLWAETPSLTDDLFVETDRARLDALKAEGRLLCALPGEAPLPMEAAWGDPDGCYAAVSVAAIVMGYVVGARAVRDLPQRWTEWGRPVPTRPEGLPTSERPLTAVFLHDLLLARATHPELGVLYPLEGGIPAPTYLAISAGTRHPELARRVFRWLFTPVAQNAIVHAGRYSAVRGMAYPEDARPLREVLGNPPSTERR